MKNIGLKSLFLLPIIFFIDYVLMVGLGCTTCFLGFSGAFYDCTYCMIGKSLFIISVIAYLYAISGDIKSAFNNKGVT